MDDCDQCGYRPKVADSHRIIMHELTPDEYVLTHVICYDCGHEWVE